ncbi:MAG: DUF1905 domain-containing protein [Terrimesophilobacter sp.]
MAVTVDLRFSGEIWYWRGPAPFHFVTVPDEQCSDIRSVSAMVTYGWGMIPATVTVGSTTLTTSLFPKNGGYIVPLRDVLRTAEGLDVGDIAEIRLAIG